MPILEYRVCDDLWVVSRPVFHEDSKSGLRFVSRLVEDYEFLFQTLGPPSRQNQYSAFYAIVWLRSVQPNRTKVIKLLTATYETTCACASWPSPPSPLAHRSMLTETLRPSTPSKPSTLVLLLLLPFGIPAHIVQPHPSPPPSRPGALPRRSDWCPPSQGRPTAHSPFAFACRQLAGPFRRASC